MNSGSSRSPASRPPATRAGSRDTTPATSSIPPLSSDGRWIAYYRVVQGQRDIWVVSADGVSPVPFTTHPASDIQPAWSRDGSKLAFTSDRDGRFHVWVGPIANGRPAGPARQITRGPSREMAPEWSPDDAWIAYTAEPTASNGDVWVMRSDGSCAPRRITTGAGALRVRWVQFDRMMVSGLWGAASLSVRFVDPADRGGHGPGAANRLRRRRGDVRFRRRHDTGARGVLPRRAHGQHLEAERPILAPSVTRPDSPGGTGAPARAGQSRKEGDQDGEEGCETETEEARPDESDHTAHPDGLLRQAGQTHPDARLREAGQTHPDWWVRKRPEEELMPPAPAIETLALVLTADCNLRCRYCYQDRKQPRPDLVAGCVGRPRRAGAVPATVRAALLLRGRAAAGISPDRSHRQACEPASSAKAPARILSHHQRAAAYPAAPGVPGAASFQRTAQLRRRGARRRTCASRAVLLCSIASSTGSAFATARTSAGA